MHDIMNILGIFILIFFAIRTNAVSCPYVKDGTCVSCDSAGFCTDVKCDNGWLDSDNDTTNGCETSNSTSPDYCETSRPSNISNCELKNDFTVKSSSFYSLLGQTPKLCYCSSPSTLERYIIGENDKCYNGLPQYRDPNVLPPAPNATTPATTPSVNITCVNVQCDFVICDDEGYYRSSDDVTCIQCEPGFFCPCDIFDSRKECESGTYQALAGQTSCDTCSGTVNADRTNCSWSTPSITNGTCITHLGATCTMVICDKGYYRSADNSTCVQCEPGYQCACDMCDTREACPSDTFQTLAGQTGCDTCSGTVNVDRTECLIAPTISNGICAQYDANTCLFANCDAGHYRSTDNSSCLSCFHGTYQDQQGQATCVNAAVGHYVAGTAQTAQTACSPGTSQASTGQQSCDDCVAGRYQAQNGQADCVNATVGHYVAGTAQTTQTVCSPGTSQASTGQTSCNDCTTGRYQAQQGQADCVNATVGHYATGTAQTAQTACSPGTSQASTGQTSCNDCTAGRYQKQSGQDSCNVCVTGYCPTGATEPLPCPAGSYITTGRANCVECAAGKFQSRPGRMECDDCPTKTIRKVSVGEYQDQTGQTSCKACIGTVSSELQSCAAKCKVGNRQHICPILLQDAATAVKYKDDLENQPCAGSTCTHGDCCDKVSPQEQTERNTKVQAEKTATVTRMSNLFTFVVQAREKIDNATIDDATAVTNKKTELEAELRIEDAATGQTREDAIGNALTAMNTALNTKMNEKLVKSMEESDEERATERVELKKKTVAEQMQERRAQAIDLSALNIKAAKDAVKETLREVEQEEEAAAADESAGKDARRQAAAAAKVTAKAAQRQLAVASSNVKKMVFESMKTAATAVASASTDDLSVIVATKDVALNPDLDEKMEKFKIEFMKLKMAKDHTTVNFNDMDNFDCVNADLNLDEMGLYDLDEVIFDKGEKAVACNLGDPVTYVEKTTNKADDYNDYEVYCCGESSGAGRLRRQLTGGLNCNQLYKDASDHLVKWNELDTYTCPSTGDYEHLVMSLGGTFTGCFLESNGTAGWVHDGPGRTLGNCGASQCTVNNTNVTCLYLGNSCQPACEAGYASDSQPLTCSGGDQYSSNTTCTGCSQGTYSSTGATTCTSCPNGTGAVALSSQCHDCPTGKYVASTAGCADCPSGKYVAATGRLGCHDVTDIATELLDATGVQCSFGGSVVYDGDGKYDTGCKQNDGSTHVDIVMYGVVEVRNAADTACENKCAKWHGELSNGFDDPKDGDSNVATYDASAIYCQYLLWTSVPIKSDECQ